VEYITLNKFEMTFCSNCGEKINEMKFCPSCGQENIVNIEKVNHTSSKPLQKNNFLKTFIITFVVGLIFFLILISLFSSGGKNDPCKCLELQGLDQMGLGLNGNQMKYLNDCVGDYGSNFLYHCGKDSVNKKYGD
jgi:predicted RNA-binding Zn-ribbon protein involved in translation (DUF1610 family)